MPTGQPVTVISRKYDLSIRRTWKCGLVSHKTGLLVFVGVFSDTIIHSHLGQITKGTVSFEYYWLERWYNVFRFHEPDGRLRNFYCNICMPPKFDGKTLDYVDLDIDLIVWPDGRVITLDEYDFAENVPKYRYPDDVIRKTFDSVTELKRLIEAAAFPFNSF